ncbi:DNA-methyltransferase [Bacillus cereus group sp. MYBK15-3]|uniref:DNA-methyltransferase n=1 Tax=unclassified Bacillus cereus group TaxID=2750818 RepID=UPI003F7A300C
MLEVNKIHKGDTFKLLDEIDDGSIDLLFTDPPYNVSVKGTKMAYGHGRTGMDFGDWDYGFDTEAWMRKVLPKINPETGQALIFNSYLNMELMARIAEEMGYIVRGLQYWYKTNPVPQMPNRLPLNALEEAMWITATDTFTFNVRDGRKAEDGRYEASPHEDQGRRFHTTQKPFSIWLEIMRVHSNKGELILDTFSGSGVTAVSADELRRNFIGFEMDNTYHEKSTKRHQKHRRKARSLWV